MAVHDLGRKRSLQVNKAQIFCAKKLSARQVVKFQKKSSGNFARYLPFTRLFHFLADVYPTISIPRPTEPLKSKSRPPKKIQQTTKNSNSTQINPVVYVAIFFGILSVILIAVLTTIIVRRRYGVVYDTRAILNGFLYPSDTSGKTFCKMRYF